MEPRCSRGRVAKASATTPPPNPNPPPQPVTEVPREPEVPATKKKAGPKKPETKPTAAAQPAPGKSKKKVAASVKTEAKSTTLVLVVPINPLEEISDLLDRLPLQACVEQTRRLLTSISSPPTETARPRAVLKIVILFVARPRRTERSKALRLAYWNADGVRGRKLELEHFLSQHGVEIYLLNETFLNAGQALRLASYVCHRTERPTAGGGTAILVRRGISHHTLPIAGLTQLEATAMQIMLAGRSVKDLAAYLSLSRPQIGADLDSCFGGWLPVLMAGDLNAKYVGWNSRLARGMGNSCVTMPMGTPVLSLNRTPQPLTHTTPLLLPMSWTS